MTLFIQPIFAVIMLKNIKDVSNKFERIIERITVSVFTVKFYIKKNHKILNKRITAVCDQNFLFAGDFIFDYIKMQLLVESFPLLKCLMKYTELNVILKAKL